MLGLQKAQEKMDKLIRKSKNTSKSLKKLIGEEDLKDKIIVKKHLQEGEGEESEY